jgi:hypothetical protein
MNNCYDPPRFNLADVATWSILILIVALFVSVLSDAKPAQPPVHATPSHAIFRPV